MITKYDRGFDRRPTAEERGPPDQTPWTEYDVNGANQGKPDFKACTWYFPCLILPVGCACCVCEVEWPDFCGCGDDADRCCDVCCRCRCGRAKLCLCCGPQCNDTCPEYCCYEEGCCHRKCANARIGAKESCCDCCDSCYHACAPRYSGCKTLCCHCSCVCCPPGCEQCCCCVEERLFMDGDLKPILSSSTDVPTASGGA